MDVIHSEEGFERPRSHPYVGTGPGHAGFVDFKIEPERIPHVLEDFVALSHEPSTQTFYGLLRWMNVNRPGIELTPRSWTNFKGFHGEVQNGVQAAGRD